MAGGTARLTESLPCQADSRLQLTATLSLEQMCEVFDDVAGTDHDCVQVTKFMLKQIGARVSLSGPGPW